MSARRTERLLNLVICLLATRRWLTKEQIRAAVPQYADCESAEAFDRMFERDKEDLRELGIPVVTGASSSAFEDEVGYRIDREAYALPPVHLTREELAVVGLASRVWQQASLAGPAARALVKLTSMGVETEDVAPAGLEPRVRTAEPAFEPLYAATRDRQPVEFTYRKPSGEASLRHVQPWMVASRGGRWYLIGFDLDRDDSRVFRLSRVEGKVRRTGRPGSYTVPDEHDLDPRLLLGGQRAQDERTATVRVRVGHGAGLRRRALGVRSAVADGWDEVDVRVGDVGSLADELAGYGPDVVALAPADVRDGVVRRLRAALDVQAGAPDTAVDLTGELPGEASGPGEELVVP
ncbi:helix-turn-helix transcriptional regulator [Spongisporangium articulatum]|uniref:Helix-turn-helix transcriptional regulator n=1 Tax=Spongisporangium articulatum TaxID=3362603 RepID=A0ABW8ARV9_9ACTN